MTGIPDEHRETIEEYIKAAQELMPNMKIIVFDVGPMSAGDRDTLTDEEREQINAAIRGGRGYYESTARTHVAVELIVAARVRAAQAQAWEEGRVYGVAQVEEVTVPRLGNPYRSDD